MGCLMFFQQYYVKIAKRKATLKHFNTVTLSQIGDQENR